MPQEVPPQVAETQRCDSATASWRRLPVTTLWVGQESVEATQDYLHVHLARNQPSLSSSNTGVAINPAAKRSAALEAL